MNPSRCVLTPAVQDASIPSAAYDGPYWYEDGSVHRLHKFRTHLLSTTVMHKTLSLYCRRTPPHFEVTIGEWKIADRTAITIETVAPDGAREKVCMIYISSNKDGQARWIMTNRVQAKNVQASLSNIREHIRILAELEELYTTSHKRGAPSGMDTTDDSWSTCSDSSGEVKIVSITPLRLK